MYMPINQHIVSHKLISSCRDVDTIIISDGSIAWMLGCDLHQEFMVLSWEAIPVKRVAYYYYSCRCIMCISTLYHTNCSLHAVTYNHHSDGSIAWVLGCDLQQEFMVLSWEVIPVESVACYSCMYIMHINTLYHTNCSHNAMFNHHF